MKKKWIAILMVAGMLTGFTTACSSDIEVVKPLATESEEDTENWKETEETDKPEMTESIDSQNVEENEAQKVYLDFLKGETKIKTADKYKEDDFSINVDGLRYGEYTYEELSETIAEFENTQMDAYYAFLIDEQKETVNMFLRFESKEFGFNNWTGILHSTEDGIILNDSFEDGYRTYATVYDNGYLEIGGSNGAGAHVSGIEKLDENGVRHSIFNGEYYVGGFATLLAYSITGGSTGLEEGYFESDDETALSVRAYVTETEVKMEVSEYSEDAVVRQREETMVNDLLELGAVLVSTEEMDQLLNTDKYKSNEVIWYHVSDGSQKDVAEEEGAELLCATFAVEEFLANPDNYDLFVADDSEYSTKIMLTNCDEPLSDFEVVVLNMREMDGGIVFEADSLYQQDALTDEKALVVQLAFPGDSPSMGFRFKDESGNSHLYSVSLSGFDGELVLQEEVEVAALN